MLDKYRLPSLKDKMREISNEEIKRKTEKLKKFTKKLGKVIKKKTQ